MTIEQFDQTDFMSGITVIYGGVEYDLAGVNFAEKLIGIQEFDTDDDEIEWKRCENVELKP